MLMGGSVVTSLSMFCRLPVVYFLGCVLVREGNKTDKKLPVRTYKIGLIQRNPGNRLIHSRRKKSLKARHASYNSSARIELKPPPQAPDGLPVSTYSAFGLEVLVRRKVV